MDVSLIGKNPNGPRGYPFIGSLPNLASSKRVDWLQSISTTYGDVVEFKLFKKNFYLVNHPDLIKEILTCDIDNYTKKQSASNSSRKFLVKAHLPPWEMTGVAKG